ncbi:MAG: 16S rRNA (cytosine(967)-C(5))-methyltransferase RsmB [Desulfobacterales bacterium]
MKSHPDNARNAALAVLNRLDKGGETLDAVLDDAREDVFHWDKREKALLNALVYGVLRNRARLDWVIGRFSKTPLKKIESQVLNILRIGLYQITDLDRIPVSAAVNTSVEMAKRNAAPWVPRFVNAVLRNASRNQGRAAPPDMAKDPLISLSISASFPEWLITRWIDRFGFCETEAMCRFLNTIPPITLRTNTLKTSRESLLEAMVEEAADARATPYSPEGIFLTGPKKPLFEMPSFKKGLFQVQDEAAQLVTRLLAPEPGQAVLDACAGLGGKTGYIAQLMNDTGRLTAADMDVHRLFQLEKEMERIGVTIAATRAVDLSKAREVASFPRFDRILIDAPCSGLGVIRRNPDIKWRMIPEHLLRLSKNQGRLLANLSERVKPGGLLVYTVCSLEPEETVDVADAFLRENPGFTLDADWDEVSISANPFKSDKGYFRTVPYVHHMDGFFSARFRKH